MRNIVIAYDITMDNGRRDKMAKELLKYGIRTQKSVFECIVTDRELKTIRKIINRYSEPEDFITFYHIKGDKIFRVGDIKMLPTDHLIF